MLSESTVEMNRQQGRESANRAVTELAVSGMTCGNCVRHVTQAIQGVTGVQSALVDLEAQRATVRWQRRSRQDVAAVLKAVADEGFEAQVIEEGATHPAQDGLAGWRINLWLGLPVTVFLMLGEWGLHLGATAWYQWLSFGLASAV